jgi:hypothetical protein
MFPKDNIPASQKDKRWLLEWGRTLQDWHLRNFNTENFPQTKFYELARYLTGNQEVIRHKPNASLLRNNNAILNFGANHRNLKIAWKYINAVHGKLNKIKVAPNIQQIDSGINDYKQDFAFKVRRLMEAKQAGIQMDQYMQQMGIAPDELPLTNDELEVFLMTKPVVYAQAEMQAAISGVFENSELDSVRREVRYDLLALGIGGIRIDTQNGVTSFRRINPMNAGTNVCKFQDFRDQRFAYEIIPVAPENIRAVCGDYFTPQQYDLIEAAAGGVSQYPYFRSSPNQMVNTLYGERYNVVVDFEVISTNSLDTEILSTDQKTRTFTYENGRNPTVEKENRTLIKAQPQYVYKGKYIIGADLIYDCGFAMQVREPIPMDPRDQILANPGKAESGFKWMQPNLVYGYSVTLLEQMLSGIDMAQKTWDQLSNVIYRLIPQGISVDLDAITDISLGAGKKMEPSDVIQMLLQYGIDIYSSSVYKGMANSSANKGVQFKENPAASNLERLLNSFTAQMNLLSSMCGITASVEGGQQSAEIGKAVTQMLEAGTDNVLDGVVFAEIKLVEKISRHMMLIAQKMGLQGNFRGKTYRIDPATHGLNIYNCKISVLPSPGEWQNLYATLDKFAIANEIDPADAVLIRKIDDYDQACLQLAVSRSRRQKMLQKSQIANQEATFKGQADVAAQSEAAKQKTIEMTTQSKIVEIKTKEEEARKTLIVKAGLEAGMLGNMIKQVLEDEIKFVDLKNMVTLGQIQQDMAPPEPPIEEPQSELIQQQEEPTEEQQYE